MWKPWRRGPEADAAIGQHLDVVARRRAVVQPPRGRRLVRERGEPGDVLRMGLHGETRRRGRPLPDQHRRPFDRRRLKRAHFIVNNSWQLGKVAQWSNPLLVSVRNALFRMIPESVNERQLKTVLEVDF